MTKQPVSASKQDKGAPGVTQEVARDFDRLAETYERKIDDAVAITGMEHTFFVDVKREHLLRLAASHFVCTTGLRVLDLGCGIGAYHKGLEHKFQELHGADVSSQSVTLAAQEHKSVQYRSFDGMTLPYPDFHFDMVFSICVLHHVPPAHWGHFVDEMTRVIRPGGLAVVFEHNPYNPATQYIVRSCEIDKDAVLLRPATLRRLFKRRLYREITTRRILSVPPKGAFLAAVDKALGRFPFGAQYYLTAIRA